MAVYLQGIAIQFYKGIGPIEQKIANFKDFNFFIGENNSGKSIVLSFIHKIFPNHGKPIEMLSADSYRGEETGIFSGKICLEKEHFMNNFMFEIEKTESIVNRINRTKNNLSLIIASLADENNNIWFKLNFDKNKTAINYSFDVKYDSKIRNSIPESEWSSIWRILNPSMSGGGVDNWISDTLQRMLGAQNFKFPKVEFIPAIREIGHKDTSFEDYSGNGLIVRLAEIQNPNHDRRSDRDIFNKINKFLQSVTGKNDAIIEIPHDREHVLVHIDKKVLPLSSLGTGIQEVIMLAAFCTLSNNCIICIEEPEIHLHPILQKKFISYLKSNTTNQYFIATHSASFIDTPDASIFHVATDGVQTKVCRSDLPEDKFEICRQLGYRASDILQSNMVIWVEGPSDRIYLKHWISALNNELVEGIHYSIMFYGGRLLSHLSAGSDDLRDFIELRSLNRNVAILIDSDKKNPYSRLNETKNRVLEEFTTRSGICWVTKGREIENYIDHKALQKVVSEKYRDRYSRPSSGDSYDHSLYFYQKAKKGSKEETIYTDIDKVAIARLCCNEPPNLDVLDLKEKIKTLVHLIEKANAL